MKISRDFYIPKGSVKVADKRSDAVVYLFKNLRGQLCAHGFHGKVSKPDFKYSFRNESARSAYIAKFFQGRQEVAERKKALQAEAKKPHSLELGHILRSSWGYEQTNIDYYQVTKLIGTRMVEIREIERVSTETAWAQGRCIPKLDAFKGEPLRRKVSNNCHVRISSSQTASVWDGRPDNWSAYH